MGSRPLIFLRFSAPRRYNPALMNWPADYPPNCPPPNSSPATGEVFRYIEGEDPESDDFRSYKESRPTEDFGRNECRSRGVSVYRDLADLAALARRNAAYRAKRVAVATLTPDSGVTLPTPNRNSPSHVTWWVPRAVEASALFHVIGGTP